MKRLAVLLSGRGTNFAAIHEAVKAGAIEAEIVAVISNRPGVPGILRAREWGYPAFEIDHRKYATRELHEDAVVHLLFEIRAEIIALAGYMRRLSPRFVHAFPNRIVNIHPSLLPAFPGVDAQAQAIAYGVKVSGCTVHLVDETVDGGAVLVQRVVRVLEEDTADSLAERILVEEHRAYVEALQLLCARDYRVEGRRVIFEPIPASSASRSTG